MTTENLHRYNLIYTTVNSVVIDQDEMTSCQFDRGGGNWSRGKFGHNVHHKNNDRKYIKSYLQDVYITDDGKMDGSEILHDNEIDNIGHIFNYVFVWKCVKDHPNM